MVNLVGFIIVTLLKASHRLRIDVFLDALTFFSFYLVLRRLKSFQKKGAACMLYGSVLESVCSPPFAFNNCYNCNITKQICLLDSDKVVKVIDEMLMMIISLNVYIQLLQLQLHIQIHMQHKINDDYRNSHSYPFSF